MSLTLHSTWLAEAQQSRCRPRFLVTIWVASATSKKMLSGRSTTMTYPQSVQSVTQFNRSMDSWSRRISTGAMSLVLRNDGFTDSLINDYGMKGTRVEIELGFEDVAEANYAPYYVGIITDIIPSPAGVLLKLKDARAKIVEGTTIGEWRNTHPLALIEDIAIDAGLPTDLIDTTAFDPSNYSSNISHYVVDRSGTDLNGERSITEPEDAAAVIDDLAAIMDGSVYIDESGLLTFSRFDSSASLDDSWTIRDLTGDPPIAIDSLYANLVNSVVIMSQPQELNLSGGLAGSVARATRGNRYSAKWIEEDTDSQGRFQYCNSSSATDAVVRRVIESPWYGGIATTNFDDVAANSTFRIYGARPYAFCGTSWPGFPSGSQPSWSPLSASRLSYVQIDEEIISCKLSSIAATDVRTGMGFDPTTMTFSAGDVTQEAGDVTLTVNARGELGTSSVSHGATRKACMDITMQVALARAKLLRFVNGGPVIRCRTNLDKYAYQIGDFIGITCSKDIYRSFGHGGLTTAVKWEIIGKRCDLFSDKPGIEWTLAYATETSPPSATYSQSKGWFQRRRDGFTRARRGAETGAEVAATTVSSGFDLTLNTFPSVTIGAGSVSNLALRGELPFDYTFDVEASKDTWISFDIENEAILQRAYASPSSEPDVDATEVMLHKVVAGAAAFTSTSDERTIQQSIGSASILQGAVYADKLAEDVEIGNLIINGDFGHWSKPFDDQTAYAPDGWKVGTMVRSTGFPAGVVEDTTLWRSSAPGSTGRVYFDTSRVKTGSAGIEFEDTSGSGTSFWYNAVNDNCVGMETIKFIPVTPGQLYMLQSAGHYDYASGELVAVRWFDKDKAYIGVSQRYQGLPAPTGGYPYYVAPRTRIYDIGTGAPYTHTHHTRCPSTAAHASVVILRPKDGNGLSQVDYIRMAKASGNFFGHRDANLLIPSTTPALNEVLLACETEEHDNGTLFSGTGGGGTGYCTIPTGGNGTYTFVASAHFAAIPAGDYVTLRLYLNGGPGVGTVIAAQTQSNGTAGALDMDANITALDIEVADTDTIAAYVGWADLGAAGGSLTVQGSTAGPNGIYTSYLAGQEKKEI